LDATGRFLLWNDFAGIAVCEFLDGYPLAWAAIYKYGTVYFSLNLTRPLFSILLDVECLDLGTMTFATNNCLPPAARHLPD
jgi:hypothetical protein